MVSKKVIEGISAGTKLMLGAKPNSVVRGLPKDEATASVAANPGARPGHTARSRFGGALLIASAARFSAITSSIVPWHVWFEIAKKCSSRVAQASRSRRSIHA